ncbi:hypothetical protein ABZ626_21505 [Streptomyces longispororuber]|uniref:hypothetical protein n=1 Tax=Streptomyces longispororuber TaxID=68230 RepID=UPI0033E64F59
MLAEWQAAETRPGLTELALWFRVKRLLPVVVTDVRRQRGARAAQDVVRRVAAASPTLFGDIPAGHQIREANRAYAQGYTETLHCACTHARRGRARPPRGRRWWRPGESGPATWRKPGRHPGPRSTPDPRRTTAPPPAPGPPQRMHRHR